MAEALNRLKGVGDRLHGTVSFKTSCWIFFFFFSKTLVKEMLSVK